MIAYVALFRTSARTVLAYRMAFWLGVLGGILPLVALFAIWGAMLGGGRTLGGLDWPQMRAYLLVTFGTGALVAAYGDFRMANRILDGRVALDLVKPVDFQRSRFAEALGGVGMELLSVALVAAGWVLISGPVLVPHGVQAALFAASLISLVPLKFAIMYLTCTLCFYTQNYVGLFWARETISALLSGALVPIALLPAWLQAISALLPFASVVSTPALIYVGAASGTTAVRLIAVQVLWTAVLWFGARLAWRFAIRRLTVHGG
ncbi:ABC-2 type transport system permease protein [Catenuloplanes nepalensis]|uniref:ABC-2 type transport system permease protein n=1 Tax=Catenuloplanes nepalensis TaxID=587533 RepID=A0ABT9N7Y9_9ACTN|nr:ABC-2 family transporter protein [Catenuloplanes nepalensis]MDP9799820.1 ABC-2 type transport system permease protein [Catenuloplanes nepalensis]